MFNKSLADNRLGETPNSVNELCAMLETNCILKKLNLSGNVLGDREIAMLLNSVDVGLFNIFKIYFMI
jgi:hypothetical protein